MQWQHQIKCESLSSRKTTAVWFVRKGELSEPTTEDRHCFGPKYQPGMRAWHHNAELFVHHVTRLLCYNWTAVTQHENNDGKSTKLNRVLGFGFHKLNSRWNAS